MLFRLYIFYLSLYLKKITAVIQSIERKIIMTNMFITKNIESTPSYLKIFWFIPKIHAINIPIIIDILKTKYIVFVLTEILLFQDLNVINVLINNIKIPTKEP